VTVSIDDVLPPSPVFCFFNEVYYEGVPLNSKMVECKLRMPYVLNNTEVPIRLTFNKKERGVDSDGKKIIVMKELLVSRVEPSVLSVAEGSQWITVKVMASL